MAQKTVRPSDRAAVVGIIDPDAYAAGTVTTGWIDMTQYNELMAVVMAGTLGAAATLDAKFQQATTAAGAGAKDITGALITQLTQAGTDSDKQAIINLWAEDLDVDGGFAFAQLSMTVAVATSDAGAVVLGMAKRHGAASSGDLASVDEIVAL
jgi:hypothetical protein